MYLSVIEWSPVRRCRGALELKGDSVRVLPLAPLPPGCSLHRPVSATEGGTLQSSIHAVIG